MQQDTSDPTAMATWYPVCEVNDLAETDRFLFELQDRAFVIAKIDDTYYAFEDLCPHQKLPLGDGPIEDHKIECPYHGAQFCLRSGKQLAPPWADNLNVFAHKIADGKIWIQL